MGSLARAITNNNLRLLQISDVPLSFANEVHNKFFWGYNFRE